MIFNKIKIKLDNLYYLFLSCFLILVIIMTSIIQLSSQRNTRNFWETFMSRYVVESNRHFFNTFFEHSNDLSTILGLNYHNFARILDGNITLRNYNLVGLNIYTVSGQQIFSRRLNTTLPTVTDEQVYELMHPYFVSIEPQIKYVVSNGQRFGIVSAPLLTNFFKHIVHIVYIFNIDHLYTQNDTFLVINIVSITIGFFFVLFWIVMRIIDKRYLKNIILYIDSNIFEKKKFNHKALPSYGFYNTLLQRISYMIAQRKELEENYLVLNERYYNFVTMTNEGFIMEDQSGYIYFSNKKFAEILEYEDESEIIGMKFSELLADSIEIQIHEMKTNILQKNVPSSYTLTFMTKKGTRKECLITNNVSIDTDNSIVNYYRTISDISLSSYYTHDQLELLNFRGKTFEQFSNPTILIDEDNVVIDANESFINYIKRSRSDLITHQFDDVIKGFELEKTWQSNTLSFELFEPTLNQWFFVHTSYVTVSRKQYKLISFFDIDFLKKQQKHISLLLNDYYGFFFITNKQDQVIYVSPSFSKITSNNDTWFINYYQSLVHLEKDSLEKMVITHHKTKFEFSITKLFTNSETLNLYQGILK